MPIAYIASAFCYGSGGSHIDSGSLDLGSAPGRSVEVYVTCPDSHSISGARIGTSGTGTELTLRDTILFGTGNYARVYVFAGLVTETGSQVVRLTTSGGFCFGIFVSRSGVASIRSGAAGANNTAPNDQPSFAGLTTVAGDTVTLFGHDGERGVTFTPGGGATERLDGQTAVYGQDQIASGTSTSVSGTMSAAGPWFAGSVVLEPIGGGGGSAAGAAAHYYRNLIGA